MRREAKEVHVVRKVIMMEVQERRRRGRQERRLKECIKEDMRTKGADERMTQHRTDWKRFTKNSDPDSSGKKLGRRLIRFSVFTSIFSSLLLFWKLFLQKMVLGQIKLSMYFTLCKVGQRKKNQAVSPSNNTIHFRIGDMKLYLKELTVTIPLLIFVVGYVYFTLIRKFERINSWLRILEVCVQIMKKIYELTPKPTINLVKKCLLSGN